MKLFSEEPELSETVLEILNIVGKSIPTPFNAISLLKLPDEIQTEYFISRRDAEFAEKGGIFVTSIMETD
ncbi:MAG: hypothetical protein NTX36_08020 [Proteobacteria bacterium]|nr:hypothetical protein [Pseudomonadota bacterium]